MTKYYGRRKIAKKTTTLPSGTYKVVLKDLFLRETIDGSLNLVLKFKIKSGYRGGLTWNREFQLVDSNGRMNPFNYKLSKFLLTDLTNGLATVNFNGDWCDYVMQLGGIKWICDKKYDWFLITHSCKCNNELEEVLGGELKEEFAFTLLSTKVEC